MSRIRTKVGALMAMTKIPRHLIVLSLAIALLAIPAILPTDAGAMRMSGRAASRACSNAGGSMYYDFLTESFSSFTMTCTLPSGSEFTCFEANSPFGGMVDCY